MTLLVRVMGWVFIGAWCVAVASHIYASRYWYPMWAARFKKKPEHEGYRRKAFIGFGIFFGAIIVGFAAGGIAQLAGGWH